MSVLSLLYNPCTSSKVSWQGQSWLGVPLLLIIRASGRERRGTGAAVGMSIWMVRNDLIFKGLPASVQRCQAIFKSEFALVILKARSSYHPAIDLWLQSYV